MTDETIHLGRSRGFMDTIVRARAAQLTTNGLPVMQRDWDHADTLTVIGVNVQPLRSSEGRSNDVRAVTSDWLLLTPPRRGDVDIQAGDRVTWSGRTLEVVAEPERWPSPSGGIDHIEAVLQVAPPYPGAGGDTTDGQIRSTTAGTVSGVSWAL